jgi:hypothetical protein
MREIGLYLYKSTKHFCFSVYVHGIFFKIFDKCRSVSRVSRQAGVQRFWQRRKSITNPGSLIDPGGSIYKAIPQQ